MMWQASHEGASLPRRKWYRHETIYRMGSMLEHRWERPGVLEGTSASEPALVIEREPQEVVAAVDVKLGAADNSGPFSR